jgi:hypothetical protein
MVRKMVVVMMMARGVYTRLKLSLEGLDFRSLTCSFTHSNIFYRRHSKARVAQAGGAAGSALPSRL